MRWFAKQTNSIPSSFVTLYHMRNSSLFTSFQHIHFLFDLWISSISTQDILFEWWKFALKSWMESQLMSFHHPPVFFFLSFLLRPESHVLKLPSALPLRLRAVTHWWRYPLFTKAFSRTNRQLFQWELFTHYLNTQCVKRIWVCMYSCLFVHMFVYEREPSHIHFHF